MSSCKFAACFQNTSLQEHLWRTASVSWIFIGETEHQSRLTILIKKPNYKLLTQKLFILKMTIHKFCEEVLWNTLIWTSVALYYVSCVIVWLSGTFFTSTQFMIISVWLEISLSSSLITQSSFTFGGSKIIYKCVS